MSETLSHLLAPDEWRAVAGLAQELRRRYPERVLQTVLFGSKARGDSQPGSDIDILVVVDREEWQLAHAISTLAANASLEHDVVIGPRVIGTERWERMKQRRFGLYLNVASEGIPLQPATVGAPDP